MSVLGLSCFLLSSAYLCCDTVRRRAAYGVQINSTPMLHVYMLLASFFLPTHLSLKHVHTGLSLCHRIPDTESKFPTLKVLCIYLVSRRHGDDLRPGAGGECSPRALVSTALELPA